MSIKKSPPWVVSGTALVLLCSACSGAGTSSSSGAAGAGKHDAAVGDVDAGDAAVPQSAIRQLEMALDALLRVTEVLADPELRGNPQAIRAALRAGAPLVVEAKQHTQTAAAELAGHPVAPVLAQALREIDQVARLAALIASSEDAGADAGNDELVQLRFDELTTHGAVALATINVALSMLGAGPSAPGQGRTLDPSELRTPEGYVATIVVSDLDFATALDVDTDGTLYVTEAGYSYGGIFTEARVRRIRPDGTNEVFATDFEAPLAGIAVSEGQVYVAQRGAITRIAVADPTDRADIVTGLPALGDHFNENLAVGPDGMLYFTIGTATNSAVVGLDNYFFGWLLERPDVHDIPCRDVQLLGVSYTTGNPLTDDVTDVATTGAFLPFGTPSTPGQVVPGQTKCNGAVLRSNTDGSGLEVFADGFRNPYGLAFRGDGRLFVTENGPDLRGSRPVRGPDNFFEVVEDQWYGFPDYFGGVIATDPSRAPEGVGVALLLQNPPGPPPLPLATFERHSSSNGFDFARSDVFAPTGTAFVAQLGDVSPPTAGGETVAAGHQVVMVSPTGEVTPFLFEAQHEDDEDGVAADAGVATAGDAGVANGGDADAGDVEELDPPVLRPTDTEFDAAGTTLYVTHFGDLRATRAGILPSPATGALIRITRVPAVDATPD